MQITHRITCETLHTDDLPSMAETLRAAIAAKVNLICADLSGADLCGADLRGANLRVAYLRDADLSGADLRGADLRDANLCDADLGGTDLGGTDLSDADLIGANLSDANLSGAKMSWNSHDMISAALLTHAGNSVSRRKVAGLILVSRDWCWHDFLKMTDDPEFEWVLDTLAPWAKDDPYAPQIFRDREAKISRMVKCVNYESSLS